MGLLHGVVDKDVLGRAGERRAAWFYRCRLFSVIARNERIEGGEIDLVVRRGALVVFVEVKTRQSLGAGEGFEAVDAKKRRQIVRLAELFLARRARLLPPLPRLRVRYDVVSLFWTGRRFELKHFPDAFRPVADEKRPWRWKT